MILKTIELILDVLIILSLLGGTFIMFSASVGILRFPDLYTRFHAAGKGATLGIACLLFGAFLFHYVEYDIVSGKLILGIFFTLLTAPVSGHMITRAAHVRGVKPYGTLKDQYQEALDAKERKQRNQ